MEWNTPPNADFDDSADSVYASNQTSHTTETKHTGKYKAQLKDDGKDLKYVLDMYIVKEAYHYFFVLHFIHVKRIIYSLVFLINRDVKNDFFADALQLKLIETEEQSCIREQRRSNFMLKN